MIYHGYLERFNVLGQVVVLEEWANEQPWCLAVSTAEEPARALIDLYAKRWGIECAFRYT